MSLTEVAKLLLIFRFSVHFPFRHAAAGIAELRNLYLLLAGKHKLEKLVKFSIESEREGGERSLSPAIEFNGRNGRGGWLRYEPWQPVCKDVVKAIPPSRIVPDDCSVFNLFSTDGNC